MSTSTRWLALVFIGVCGSAASAQAPYPYGGQPYPPNPYAQPIPYAQPNPYVQPMPQYPPRRGYAPPGYYPQQQPQPRVMYVSATPIEGPGGPAMAFTAPRSPVSFPLPMGPVVPSSSTNSASPANNAVAVRTDAQTNPAQIASLRKDSAWEGSPPENCQSEIGGCTLAPKPPTHPGHHAHRDEDCTTNWLPMNHWNLQVMGGFYADVSSAKYNWGQGVVRLGKICSGECFPPGAFETLIEFNAAGNWQSEFGSHFMGGGLLLRYNFVNPGSRLVPYVQVGAGFQYNDSAREDAVQAFLGSPVELTGQAQVGFRVFLCKNFTLDIEGGVQRLTNLNMSNRDDGITGLGGMAGVTYFFPCGTHHH